MTSPPQHTDVGAYALGILDAEDVPRFEEHLATCERCAAELDGLVALEPVLAEAAAGEGAGEGPGPAVLAGLLDEVAAVRRTRRRNRLYLVAAAGALIVGGPLAAVALTAGGTNGGPDDLAHSSPARAMYEHGEKHGATDPVTDVAATVSLEKKPWGTHVALRLANVTGPLTCDLVAVGRDGARQTVTTWAVPPSGYGVKGGSSKWNREPLFTHGGAAMNRDDIDHFEVRTLDGRRLASVKV